jgi:hypothetical protein
MFVLSLFKIKIHDKVFIGSTYNYNQFIHKFKSTNYFSKIKKYVLLYDYIIQNNINMAHIELECFYKKTYSIKNNIIKDKTTKEFIDIYDTLSPNGFNYIKHPFDKIAYYKKYRIRKKKSKAEQKIYNREKSLLFYNNNRERILKKNRLKIHCECGSYVVINQLKRHKKTVKHKYLILTNNNNVIST